MPKYTTRERSARRLRAAAARLTGERAAAIATSEGVTTKTIENDLRAAREGAVDFGEGLPLLQNLAGDVLRQAFESGDLRGALQAIGRYQDLLIAGQARRELADIWRLMESEGLLRDGEEHPGRDCEGEGRAGEGA